MDGGHPTLCLACWSIKEAKFGIRMTAFWSEVRSMLCGESFFVPPEDKND